MKITQIELPLNSSFPSVNIYLAAGNQLSVVDAGKSLDGNWELFCEDLNAAGYELSDIDQVVLTHHHQDHIALLTQILDNSQATVLAPKCIEPWLRNYETMLKKSVVFIKNILGTLGFPSAMAKKIFYVLKRETEDGVVVNIDLDRVTYFEDGDIINIGGEAWKAIYVPGHTNMQFCFIQEATKQILGGDMLLPLTPMPVFDEDVNEKGKRVKGLPQLLKSYERLCQYDLQKVYPGHGQPFEHANIVIEKQVERIENRKAQCLTVIQQGNETIFDIINALYPTKPGLIHFGGMLMTLGYVDLLEAEGKVKVSEVRDAETQEVTLRVIETSSDLI